MYILHPHSPLTLLHINQGTICYKEDRPKIICISYSSSRYITRKSVKNDASQPWWPHPQSCSHGYLMLLSTNYSISFDHLISTTPSFLEHIDQIYPQVKICLSVEKCWLTFHIRWNHVFSHQPRIFIAHSYIRVCCIYIQFNSHLILYIFRH